jgi:hypothetical protein
MIVDDSKSEWVGTQPSLPPPTRNRLQEAENASFNDNSTISTKWSVNQ